MIFVMVNMSLWLAPESAGLASFSLAQVVGYRPRSQGSISLPSARLLFQNGFNKKN